VLAALLVLLTGCTRCGGGGAGGAGAGDGGGAPGAQALTLQVFGDPVEVQAYRDLVAGFTRAHPGAQVELVPVGNQREHMTRLVTAFSGGRPPDLFVLNYRRFGQLAERGVLEPLGPLVEARGALPLADFYPQALEAFRLGGAQVCLPQNVSSLVVYYNRALLQQAGLAAPAAGWTWEAMLGAAKALTRDTDGDGVADVHGLGVEPTLARLAPFVWQAGGDVVNNVQTPRVLRLRATESREALRFVHALRHTHGVTPPLEAVRSEDLETRFARGRLGMLLHSRRLTATLREVQGLEWDVAPLPVHRQAASLLHADAYCLARASPARELALRFVEYALGPEGAGLLARSGRTVPSRRSVAESPAFLDPSQPPASARVFLDAIPQLRRLPNIAVWNEVETRLDGVVEEWYYAAQPGTALPAPADAGTGLAAAAPRPDAGEPPRPGGSAKHLMRVPDASSVLSNEAEEAVRGLIGFGAPPGQR
jgi:multiple sugar transport system substrate-binding protein